MDYSITSIYTKGAKERRWVKMHLDLDQKCNKEELDQMKEMIIHLSVEMASHHKIYMYKHKYFSLGLKLSFFFSSITRILLYLSFVSFSLPTLMCYLLIPIPISAMLLIKRLCLHSSLQ